MSGMDVFGIYSLMHESFRIMAFKTKRVSHLESVLSIWVCPPARLPACSHHSVKITYEKILLCSKLTNENELLLYSNSLIYVCALSLEHIMIYFFSTKQFYHHEFCMSPLCHWNESQSVWQTIGWLSRVRY